MSVFTMVVAVVAIIAGSLISAFKIHAKNRSSASNAEEFEKLQEELDELRQRVASLEKIVTDDSYELKKEINSL